MIFQDRGQKTISVLSNTGWEKTNITLDEALQGLLNGAEFRSKHLMTALDTPERIETYYETRTI